LIQAIQKDIDFLADAGIMDYSLFLSFHIKPPSDSLGSERLDLDVPRAPVSAGDDSRITTTNRGIFRQQKGGLAVQLNPCEPFEFLRRPDGHIVQKVASRSSLFESKDSVALSVISTESVEYSMLMKAEPHAAGKNIKNNHTPVMSIF
jgi:hypothetical protein